VIGLTSEIVEPTDLIAGDIFRLFESDYTPVKDSEGFVYNRLLAPAYLNEQGIYCFNCYGIPEPDKIKV
jgi:hypothetical protein